MTEAVDRFAEYKARRPAPRGGIGTYLLMAAFAVAAGGTIWANFGHVYRILPLVVGGGAGGGGPVRGDFEAGVLTVVMLNVGQGDATYIHTPNGRNVLFDAGTGGTRYAIYEGYSHYNAGEEVTVPFLREHGVAWIDTVVISHPDGDHSGGMMDVWEYLFEEAGGGVGHYIDPGVQVTDKAYADQLRYLLEKTDVPYTAILDPDSRTPTVDLPWEFIGDPAIAGQILGPLEDNGWEEQPNEQSVVIHLQAGPFSFLMAGDAENREEESLVEYYGPRLRTTVMFAPHHGSKTSILPAFLGMVNPRIIAVSSWTPMYGHPPPITIESWERHIHPRPHLFRTHFQGTVWFRVTPEALTIRTARPLRDPEVQWKGGELSRVLVQRIKKGEGVAENRAALEELENLYGRKPEPDPPPRWEELPHEFRFTPADLGVAP